MSKSAPPRRVFPTEASTSNIPSVIWSIDTSSVPPPRSYTNTYRPLSELDLFFSDLSISPYANAAAVGSFIILIQSRPAIVAASFVACLCESLKYAGTVMTAFLTDSPKYSVAICFAFINIIDDISSGVYPPPISVPRTILLSPSGDILYVKYSLSKFTEESLYFLPISLLTSYNTFPEFNSFWFFASYPIYLFTFVNPT